VLCCRLRPAERAHFPSHAPSMLVSGSDWRNGVRNRHLRCKIPSRTCLHWVISDRSIRQQRSRHVRFAPQANIPLRRLDPMSVHTARSQRLGIEHLRTLARPQRAQSCLKLAQNGPHQQDIKLAAINQRLVELFRTRQLLANAVGVREGCSPDDPLVVPRTESPSARDPLAGFCFGRGISPPSQGRDDSSIAHSITTRAA
jgi:hypothetical protein